MVEGPSLPHSVVSTSSLKSCDGEDRCLRKCCTACFKSKLSKLDNACEQAIMEGWQVQGDCLQSVDGHLLISMGREGERNYSMALYAGGRCRPHAVMHGRVQADNQKQASL